MVQIVNSELVTRFIVLVNAADACHEEYSTTHGDVGDAHIQLVSEGNQAELLGKIKENAITMGATEAEAVLISRRYDSYAVESRPCHRFSSFDAASIGGLLVGGPWMIEEIKNQHEVSRYAAELDCDESTIRQLVISPMADNELCIRWHGDKFETFYTYIVTDCGWYAILPASWFIETIAEIRQEAAEAAEAELREWFDSQSDEFMRPCVEYFTAGEIEFDSDNPNEENEPCAAGWYARLSAHGYMDCTEWQGPYETEAEAARGLFETFAD